MPAIVTSTVSAQKIGGTVSWTVPQVKSWEERVPSVPRVSCAYAADAS